MSGTADDRLLNDGAGSKERGQTGQETGIRSGDKGSGEGKGELSQVTDDWFPAIPNKRVLVIGDVMHDIVAKPEGPLIKGSDRRADIRHVIGGSGGNQAMWFAHFGVARGLDVRLAARIGAADLDYFKSHFEACGIDARLAVDLERPTGTLISLVDPDGERSFLTDRGANERLCEEDLAQDLLAGVGLLHVSAYSLFAEGPRRAVLRLMDRAIQSGIPVSVDPASASFLREAGADAFLDWTRGATIVFPNQDEAEVLTSAKEPEAQLAILSQTYPMIALTCGGDGAWFSHLARQVMHRVSAPSLKVVDSTGAGDAFLSAFQVSVIYNENDVSCLKNGVKAGADVTLNYGGQPKRPDRRML